MGSAYATSLDSPWFCLRGFGKQDTPFRAPLHTFLCETVHVNSTDVNRWRRGRIKCSKAFLPTSTQFPKLTCLKMLKFATVVGKTIVALSVELREMATALVAKEIDQIKVFVCRSVAKPR
jgi:hypothetical protein